MAITLVKLTDTFNTFMDLVNSIINKINKVNVDTETVKLAFKAQAPADSDLSASEGILYFDASGDLHFKRKLSDGTTIQVKKITFTDVS